MTRSLLQVLLSFNLCTLVLLLSAGTASANAGPVEWATSDYGGTVVPVKNHAISVLGEHLTVDLAGAKRYDSGITTVPIRATYRLRNESGASQTALLAFPYWTHWESVDPKQRPEARFSVTLNEVALPVHSVNIDIAHEVIPEGEGVLRQLRERVLNSGRLINIGPAAQPQSWAMRALAFEVSLPPGEERTLEVSYLQEAAVSKHDSPSFDIVQIDYVLQTARYWRDFRDLEVEVRAPRGTHIESNLALSLVTRSDIDVYRFRSPTLPGINLRAAALWPVSWDVALFRTIGGGDDYQGRMRLIFMYLPLGLVALAVVGLIAYRARRWRGNESP